MAARPWFIPVPVVIEGDALPYTGLYCPPSQMADFIREVGEPGFNHELYLPSTCLRMERHVALNAREFRRDDDIPVGLLCWGRVEHDGPTPTQSFWFIRSGVNPYQALIIKTDPSYRETLAPGLVSFTHLIRNRPGHTTCFLWEPLYVYESGGVVDGYRRPTGVYAPELEAFHFSDTFTLLHFPTNEVLRVLEDDFASTGRNAFSPRPIPEMPRTEQVWRAVQPPPPEEDRVVILGRATTPDPVQVTVGPAPGTTPRTPEGTPVVNHAIQAAAVALAAEPMTRPRDVRLGVDPATEIIDEDHFGEQLHDWLYEHTPDDEFVRLNSTRGEESFLNAVCRRVREGIASWREVAPSAERSLRENLRALIYTALEAEGMPYFDTPDIVDNSIDGWLEDLIFPEWMTNLAHDEHADLAAATEAVLENLDPEESTEPDEEDPIDPTAGYICGDPDKTCIYYSPEILPGSGWRYGIQLDHRELEVNRPFQVFIQTPLAEKVADGFVRTPDAEWAARSVDEKMEFLANSVTTMSRQVVHGLQAGLLNRLAVVLRTKDPEQLWKHCYHPGMDNNPWLANRPTFLLGMACSTFSGSFPVNLPKPSTEFMLDFLYGIVQFIDTVMPAEELTERARQVKFNTTLVSSSGDVIEPQRTDTPAQNTSRQTTPATPPQTASSRSLERARALLGERIAGLRFQLRDGYSESGRARVRRSGIISASFTAENLLARLIRRAEQESFDPEESDIDDFITDSIDYFLREDGDTSIDDEEVDDFESNGTDTDGDMEVATEYGVRSREGLVLETPPVQASALPGLIEDAFRSYMERND